MLIEFSTFLAQRTKAWDPDWWPRDSSGVWWRSLLVIFATLGLIVMIRIGMDLANKMKKRARPNRVFDTIADEFGLSGPQKRLLSRISRSQGLPSPITLLLSPTTLNHHADAYFENRGISDADLLREQLAILRIQLFHDASGAAEGYSDPSDIESKRPSAKSKTSAA